MTKAHQLALCALDEHPIQDLSCHRCGQKAANGLYGPNWIADDSQPGIVENHQNRWYCVRHGNALWRRWIEMREVLPARLERLECWKRGELDFQIARSVR